MVENNEDDFRHSDVLFTVDVDRTLEQTFSVPAPGSYWFIIENGAAVDGQIKLACTEK